MACLLCVAVDSGYEEGRKLFSSEGSPVLFGVPHRRRAASAYVRVAVGGDWLVRLAEKSLL